MIPHPRGIFQQVDRLESLRDHGHTLPPRDPDKDEADEDEEDEDRADEPPVVREPDGRRLVQLVFKSYETMKCLYVIKKVGFRYRQAETAGIASVERLERTAGLASAVRWLRKAHVAQHFRVEKPTQKLRSFFSRWSIKFSTEYYEAKERQASNTSLSNSSKLRTLR